MMQLSLMTWNVNSVRARLENILECLQKYQPDIVALQEIKCLDEQFPQEVFEDIGYQSYVFGQKSYHGVAFLSKYSLENVKKGLPDFEDTQARFIEADICVSQKTIKIINCYMPNGNPVGGDKYAYKLAWLQALDAYLHQLRHDKIAFILCGDFNIIPTPLDTHDVSAWQNDALFQQEVRAFYHQWCYAGLTDIIRMAYPRQAIYSFWDYQGRAKEKNHGIRIDHFLTTPDIADIVQTASILEDVRELLKASDHAPVMMTWQM